MNMVEEGEVRPPGTMIGGYDSDEDRFTKKVNAMAAIAPNTSSMPKAKQGLVPRINREDQVPGATWVPNEAEPTRTADANRIISPTNQSSTSVCKRLYSGKSPICNTLLLLLFTTNIVLLAIKIRLELNQECESRI